MSRPESTIVKDWITKAGLRAVIIRVEGDKWHCGYVGVNKDNPLYGKPYSELYNLDYDISVHGGLTYSASQLYSLYKSENSPKDLWWFGFDCAHFGDANSPDKETCEAIWRDESYVTRECEELAQQIVNLAKKDQ